MVRGQASGWVGLGERVGARDGSMQTADKVPTRHFSAMLCSRSSKLCASPALSLWR